MANRSILEIIIGLKDETSSRLKGLLGNIKSFGDGVKSAFHSEPVRLFRNAVVAVTAALAASVVEAARFNIQVARVWTMAGGGISTFKELRNEARSLASDFGKSRSEIANGMYNALSAGIDKSNLKSFMTTAAKVAVADGSDVSVAVDGITTVLNAFKIKSTETEAVTDKLFKTVAMGKTTFGDLAANLATVAPIAAASDIPLEQILAHVAALTAQGTPTAQAMTQIRASIIGLNKALGDGWSGTMSYQDALKAVWQQAGQSQTKLLELVGSTEAVQAVLGGVGINADMATVKLKGMADTAGAAQEAFERVQQFRHWPTLLETARGILSKFGEELDQRIAPYVTNVTEQLRKWRDDEGLWDTIGGFMDAAVAKLDSITRQTIEIINQIKSVDDLKIVAGVIGDWMRDKLVEGGHRIAAFLMEKAPVIGDAIGRAIVKGVNAVAQDAADRYVAKQQMRQRGIETTPENVNQYVHETRAAAFESQGKELAAQIEISAASQQSLADRITAALTAKASEPKNDSERLTRALETGLNGEALDKLISGLELTAEDLQLLADYTETYTEKSSEASEKANAAAEAAKTTAESATKAAEASVDSNTKVTSALDRSKDALLSAAQAADRNIQITEQVVAFTATFPGRFSALENKVNNIVGQLNSMRA